MMTLMTIIILCSQVLRDLTKRKIRYEEGVLVNVTFVSLSSSSSVPTSSLEIKLTIY